MFLVINEWLHPAKYLKLTSASLKVLKVAILWDLYSCFFCDWGSDKSWGFALSIFKLLNRCSVDVVSVV